MGRGRRRELTEFTQCTNCKTTFPTTKENFHFYTGRAYPHSWCRTCERTYSRERAKTDEGKKVRAAWLQSANGKKLAKAQQLRANQRRKEFNKLDPDRFRSYELKKRIGITLEQKNCKFNEQGRKCAICKSSVPNTKNQWFADHDHKTKKFRGVLCGHCNSVLGYADDSPAILFAAAVYLLKYNQNCDIIQNEEKAA